MRRSFRTALKLVGSVACAAAVGGPIGGMLGSLGGELLGKMLESSAQEVAGILSDLSTNVLKDFAKGLGGSPNHDLQRALAAALESALQRKRDELRREEGTNRFLRGKLLSDEHERLFALWLKKLQQAQSDEQALQELLSGEVTPEAILQAVDAKDEQQAWWQFVEQALTAWAGGQSIPDDLGNFLRERLPQNLQAALAEILKDPKHQRAWIAFQRTMMTETLSLVRHVQDQLTDLTKEQQQGFAQLQKHLETLSTAPELLTQLSRAMTEILAAVHEGTERIEQLLETLSVTLLREIRRRPLYERYAGLEVADRVEELLRDYTTLFVGRKDELAQLDGLLSAKLSGKLIITAKAGFGKTALLANWVARRRGDGCFVACHFFSHRYDATRSVVNAYRNLLRQLFIYHELADEPLPDDENSLRDTLYGIVKERGARPDEPLIIVLDGLDEAEHVFSPPFPVPLPEGVFVVVSARADEGEEPDYLRSWMDVAKRLHLTRLPRIAIADYLRRAGDGELAAFAEDEGFIAQVDETTEGFPLYLRFLIDEMIQAAKAGQDVQAVLTRSPRGFGAYVREQLRLLAQVEEVQQKREVQELFALLSVALGALSEDDVQALTGLTVFDLRALPWQATRWFTIQTRPPAQTLYAFAHALLADEFERALGRQAQDARNKLMDYCSRWQEHRSPYALRHYAEHLIDLGKLAEAVEILTDVEFIEARCRGDFLRHHMRECKAMVGKISDATPREILRTVASAIAIERPTLERFPELTFQALVNSCRWVDAAWTQSLIQRWMSSWESSGHGAWLERLLPPREIPQKSPITMVLPDAFVRSLAFSSDGKYLAGAGGRSVIVWEVESGEEICVLEVPKFINGGLIDVAWSGDGRWIAAIGNLEGYLALWDFRDKRLRFFKKVHEFGRTVAFCPQELRDPFYDWDLLTCGRDSFRLWFIQEDCDEVISEALDVSGEKLRFIQIMLGDAIPWKPPLAGAAWVKLDGQQVIAVAAESGQIVLLKAGLRPVAGANPGLSLHHVSATEDGRFIALVQDVNESPLPGAARMGNDHCFFLIDNEQEQDISGFRLKGHIAKISLLSAENRMLTCEEDTGLAILWNLVPFSMKGAWQGPSIGLWAGALGKGNRIAISTKHDSVMLLTPEAMSSHPEDSAGHVWSMSISADGDSIVAARAGHYLDSRFEGDLALVRLKNQKIMSLESFKERDAPLSTAYLPDGRFVTGHMDGTIRLWSPNGSLELKHLIRKDVGIGNICVSKSGELVALSCGSWYDRHEVPDTIHVLQIADMSEVFTGGAGERGYGGKPGNALAFGGRDNDLLICGGSPIRMWRKSDSGWEIAAEIENDLGVILDIAWSLHLGGFIFSYGSWHSGGLGLLRPTSTDWQKTVWRTGKITLGLGISECGQFIAFGDADRVCRFCRFEDNGSITVLAKHFIHAAAEVCSAVVSWTHRLVAFGDANGDIHVFRYHE